MKLRSLWERNRVRWLLIPLLVAVVAWAVLQELKVALLWSLISAVAAATVPIIVAQLTDRFTRDDDRTRVCLAALRCYSRRRGAPLVGAFRDYQVLGIGKSREQSGSGAYVARDKDTDLDALLDTRPFVLLVGDSRTGKSRMAAEAIDRKFPDRRLLIPAGPESLPALLDAEFDFTDSVVWLDELQRYLEQTGLARLLDVLDGPDKPRGVTVLATIREKKYAEYMPGGDVESPYWPVLQRASQLRIERLLSTDELERAATVFHDPAMLAELGRFGLAEYLSAGPDLLIRLERELITEPVNAIVVLAAADWSRAGLSRPVPTAVLGELAATYLSTLAIPGSSPADISSALAWAQHPVYGASRLLSANEDGYVAFDYVVDSRDQSPLPDGVWEVALTSAAGDEIVQVGLAANKENRLDIAVRAFEVALQRGGPHIDRTLAEYNYASVLERAGQLAKAQEYYALAARAGHAEAATAAGRLAQARGDIAEAVGFYRQAAAADSTGAALALGMLLREQDPDEALTWLERAAGAGNTDAAVAAGQLRESHGDRSRAEAWYRQAVAGGSANAALALGILLRVSDPTEALHWLDEAAQAGNAEGALAAASLLDGQGRVGEAERYRRMAVASGEPERSREVARRSDLLATIRAGGQDLRVAAVIVSRASDLESVMTGYSESELGQLSSRYAHRLANGESADDLLPEAFAAVREAARRAHGQRCADVQLVAGVALHLGYVAEMPRGEGWSLAITMAAYLNALGGGAVHVLTTDRAQARAEADFADGIYQRLGLHAGVIAGDMSHNARIAAYRAAVTYGHVGDLIFDFLTDSMTWTPDDLVQRPARFAIADEAGLLLLDEPFQPYEKTASGEQASRWPEVFARVSARLQPGEHYVVDRPAGSVTPTGEGIDLVEQWLGVDNLYETLNTPLIRFLELSLRAKELYQRDRQYAVRNGEIVILDAETGRARPGQRFGRGLHEAVTAKEGLSVHSEQTVLARIDIWAYLRQYPKLAGITGTAGLQADEFRLFYNLEVATVPASRPGRLHRPDDLLFSTDERRWEAAADLVRDHHRAGQPVLIDVTSDARADLMSDRLGRLGIPHRVLRTDQQAAGGSLLAEAGRMGSVTVVTDASRLPGRIPLGGPEASDAERDEVAAAGGLVVLATERRLSRADDSRLCDVAAADGDPGECIFMMARGDRLADCMRWWPAALAGDVPVSSSMVNWAVASLQRQLAAVHLDRLKQNLAWARVFEEQRAQMSLARARMLSGDDISELMLGYLREVVDRYIARWAAGDSDPEALERAFRQLLGANAETVALPGRPGGHGHRDVAASTHAVAERAWARRAAELGPEVWLELQRRILMTVLDRNWRDYMQALEEIREHAPLQGFSGRDPLAAYQASAQEEFAVLEDTVKEESIGLCMNVDVEIQEPPEPPGTAPADATVSAEPGGAPPAIGPPGT